MRRLFNLHLSDLTKGVKGISNIYDFLLHNAYQLHKDKCSENNQLCHSKFFEAVVANEIPETEPPSEAYTLFDPNLCLTTSGNCYHESHHRTEYRRRSQYCCSYCKKRCCPDHRHFICYACYVFILPFHFLHDVLRALLPEFRLYV